MVGFANPPRGQFLSEVIENAPLCREHFRLVLRVESGFAPTEPGQFVQISCGPDALLRRPFSLAGRRDRDAGSCELDIIHRVVGVGTRWLAHLREGDQVGILGPLGNRFALPAADETALLVGGGVGIPPMLYLAARLGRVGRGGVAFVGATTSDLLPVTVSERGVEEFGRHGIESVMSTDDGSLGFRGFVTQALESWLDDNRKSQTVNRKFVLYTCGPELMMKRVAIIGAERDIPVHVAVERAMACGMGTCQSCCIRVKVPRELDPDGWRYKLACTDGPIFAGSDLLW